jgi:hypothetical protein
MRGPSGDSTPGVPGILFFGIYHSLTTQRPPVPSEKSADCGVAIHADAPARELSPAHRNINLQGTRCECGRCGGLRRRRDQGSLFGGKLDTNLLAMQTPDRSGHLEHLAHAAGEILNEGDLVGHQHQRLGFQDSLAKAGLRNQR